MELRRARWLEKIAKMDETRGPRKMLVAWTPQARSAGRPKQTIKRAYADTVTNQLGFENDGFNTWMTVAKDYRTWARNTETQLKLARNTYKPHKKRKTNQSESDEGTG